MATNYERGREKEWQAIKELQDNGYIAGRTAGSHSPFDVWAVNQSHTRFLQIKRCKAYHPSFYKEELIKAREAAKNVHKNCQIEFWIWLDKKGWIVQEIIKKAGE